MKKIVFLLCAFGLLSALSADVLRIEAGAGAWNQEVDGTFKYLTAPTFETDDLGYSDETKAYIWVNVKDPLPIVPNVRFEYVDIEFTGTATSGFVFDGKLFPSKTKSTTALEQIDTVLYYNILDNTAFTTLDLGLDIKYVDASFDASSIILNTTIRTNDQVDLFFPLAYGRLRFELPFDIGLETEAKYMQYKASKIQDYSIKADYTLVNMLPIDIGLELGYRFEKVNLNQDDFNEIDFDADLDVDGIFAGAVIRF